MNRWVLLLLLPLVGCADYAAHDALQAAQKQAAEIRAQSKEGQIALIVFCTKKGGVPIILNIGTDYVRLTDCKFPLTIE